MVELGTSYYVMCVLLIVLGIIGVCLFISGITKDNLLRNMFMDNDIDEKTYKKYKKG